MNDQSNQRLSVRYLLQRQVRWGRFSRKVCVPILEKSKEQAGRKTFHFFQKNSPRPFERGELVLDAVGFGVLSCVLSKWEFAIETSRGWNKKNCFSAIGRKKKNPTEGMEICRDCREKGGILDGFTRDSFSYKKPTPPEEHRRRRPVLDAVGKFYLTTLLSNVSSTPNRQGVEPIFLKKIFNN